MNKIIDDIPEEVMEVLCLHDWPGNIRELQNFVERAVVVTEGRLLRPPLSELTRLMPVASTEPSRTLEEVERVYIAATLHKTNWVVGGPAGAAARLGLPRTTLISRMRKLGISRDTADLRGTWAQPPATNSVPFGNYREAFAQAG